MKANTIPRDLSLASSIPGTAQTQYGLAIVNIQIFYRHAEQTIDLAEQRRLWCEKNKR